MNWLGLLLGAAIVAFVPSAFAETPGRFSDVRIEAEFSELLMGNPFLMSEGGAKFLRLPGGTNVLFAVGMTDRRSGGNPAAEALRKRTVADRKARKSVTEALHSVHVYSFVQTRDMTAIRRVGETEEVLADVTDLFEQSESTVSGWIPGLPVVGTWVIPDDNLFCLAIGRFFPPLKQSPQ